mmetsp:Transcript_12490/g.31380  ORF Transcript_12490/g.31380 Transcript_12490/m.31380 type:complete len:341 (-) Transcript_12490:398-1420(-)
MVQITRHSSEAKATHFSAALLLWGLACVAILASSSRLSSPPTPSTTSLFSSSGASSSVPLTSFLHNAEGEMEALRASIPSAKPSEAQRLSSLFHNSDKSLQQVGNAEAARRASAQKRAVNAFSSAKHAAHRTRSASESSKEKSTARALHRGNEEAKMRHDVAASEERIKKMERQLPEAERRAFPTEARKVEEVLGKAAAQLDSINRKARRSSSKKTRKTQALHSGSLQAAKAADDRENSALAREEDASDVLSAVNSLPSPSSPKRSHRTSKVVSQKKGRMQDLAEVSDHRQWGKVYDPTVPNPAPGCVLRDCVGCVGCVGVDADKTWLWGAGGEGEGVWS